MLLAETASTVESAAWQGHLKWPGPLGRAWPPSSVTLGRPVQNTELDHLLLPEIKK